MFNEMRWWDENTGGACKNYFLVCVLDNTLMCGSVSIRIDHSPKRSNRCYRTPCNPLHQLYHRTPQAFVHCWRQIASGNVFLRGRFITVLASTQMMSTSPIFWRIIIFIILIFREWWDGAASWKRFGVSGIVLSSRQYKACVGKTRTEKKIRWSHLEGWIHLSSG